MESPILVPAAPVYIADAATVVGHEEFKGPLGSCFDLHDPDDDRFGQKNWEMAESEMQRMAVGLLMKRYGRSEETVGALFAGDLMNQCTASGYGLLTYDIPFFGLYGACSTAAEGLILGSVYCGTYQRTTVTVTSSHFCSAERQFRFPMEYGGQRTPTAQWTVTGAAAFRLTTERRDFCSAAVRIADCLPGITVDRGITDANNMGAAMAPAALDTLVRYFRATGKPPASFDRIVTGDLGREGSELLCDFAEAAGFPIRPIHCDCGRMIYDCEAEDKHAGGSGCGCSGVVLAGHLLPQLREHKLRNILFVGTGALLSPMRVQQGETIPGIAHLVHITTEE